MLLSSTVSGSPNACTQLFLALFCHLQVGQLDKKYSHCFEFRKSRIPISRGAEVSGSTAGNKPPALLLPAPHYRAHEIPISCTACTGAGRLGSWASCCKHCASLLSHSAPTWRAMKGIFNSLATALHK